MSGWNQAGRERSSTVPGTSFSPKAKGESPAEPAHNSGAGGTTPRRIVRWGEMPSRAGIGDREPKC